MIFVALYTLLSKRGVLIHIIKQAKKFGSTMAGWGTGYASDEHVQMAAGTTPVWRRGLRNRIMRQCVRDDVWQSYDRMQLCVSSEAN